MNSKESLIYTEYKTISMLPEEILGAYHDKMTIEKIEVLYEKVKYLLSEIPEEEAQNYLEQMGQYLQAILDGKRQILEQKISVERQNRRPRLKAKCEKCQRTTYLQFTDGYYCPNCNSVHVEHINKNKKLLKDMLQKLLQPSQLQPQEELHIIQEMLKLDEESAQIYVKLGHYYYRQTEYEKALEAYKKAIELDEQDGAIYENMGLVYMSMEDFDQAAVQLGKAFQLWKKGDYSKWNSSYLFANYAIALQKTGNYEMAFEMFKMARDAEYPLYDALVENHGIGKEIYGSRIGELMNQAYRTYSENYKIDLNTLKKVRKIFNIPESAKMVGFFDYTLFGSAREGIAVTSDGLYFRTLMPKVMSIKWYELSQYDMDYKNCIQLKLKKESTNTIEMCFQALLDATKFLEVMKAMQNL